MHAKYKKRLAKENRKKQLRCELLCLQRAPTSKAERDALKLAAEQAYEKHQRKMQRKCRLQVLANNARTKAKRAKRS